MTPLPGYEPSRCPVRTKKPFRDAPNPSKTVWRATRLTGPLGFRLPTEPAWA
jgi:hypothetical protein